MNNSSSQTIQLTFRPDDIQTDLTHLYFVFFVVKQDSGSGGVGNIEDGVTVVKTISIEKGAVFSETLSIDPLGTPPPSADLGSWRAEVF